MDRKGDHVDYDEVFQIYPEEVSDSTYDEVEKYLKRFRSVVTSMFSL